MGALPLWLLTHTVTVEQYLAWNTFGPPAGLRCLIDENLTNAGPAGTERVAQLSLIAGPDASVAPGSRITLADQRRGYASAVVNHSGGGLPTPDHVQVAVQIATSYGPAFGESVTLLIRTQRRTTGGAMQTFTRSVVVEGAAVRLLSATEAVLGSAVQAVDTVEVVLPPGTVISVRDSMIVRGLTYEVDGSPTEASDPNTTARPGVKVIGKRKG